MNVKNIKIKDFKGFDEVEFNFNNQFNVIIGENAVGKTSLLEAVVAGMGGFIKGINYKNGASIKNEDVRITSYKTSIKYSANSSIITTADLLGEEYIWKRYRERNENLNDLNLYKNVYEFGQYLATESKSGRYTTLPLVSFYGTGRLMKENDSEFNASKTSKRIDGYNKALNPNSNYKTLLSWFKSTEITVYKSGKQLDVLQSVKRAIRNSFEEIETIYYDQENKMLSILKKGLNKSQSIPVRTLSDGQKKLIGLIGDIALRCILLNPHFGAEAHSKTSGIILIDELDLHLHPNWQKKIVQILKTTFPKMQFITTSHSPFIIQSLENEELIDLQTKNLDTDYFRKSIEEISSEEMGVVSNRSKRFQQMMKTATEYYDLLQKDNKSIKIESLKIKLDALELKFNEDPAYVSLLTMERKMKGL
jgi:predicted ATP-binding protein involved in virulence